MTGQRARESRKITAEAGSVPELHQDNHFLHKVTKMASSNYISLVRDTDAGDGRAAEYPQASHGSAKEVKTDNIHSNAGDSVTGGHTVNVLAQAIQHEIIPRLMLALRTPAEGCSRAALTTSICDSTEPSP